MDGLVVIEVRGGWIVRQESHVVDRKGKNVEDIRPVDQQWQCVPRLRTKRKAQRELAGRGINNQDTLYDEQRRKSYL